MSLSISSRAQENISAPYEASAVPGQFVAGPALRPRTSVYRWNFFFPFGPAVRLSSVNLFFMRAFFSARQSWARQQRSKSLKGHMTRADSFFLLSFCFLFCRHLSTGLLICWRANVERGMRAMLPFLLLEACFSSFLSLPRDTGKHNRRAFLCRYRSNSRLLTAHDFSFSCWSG